MQTLLPLLFHPVLLFSVFIIFFIFLLQKWLSSKTLPPSPPKLPIFGNLLNLGSHPYKTLATYAQQYGPLFFLHFGSVPTLIVSSAEIARDIMKTHDLIFSNRPKLSLNDRLLYGCRDIAAAPYGDYWRQMKSAFVLHMVSNKRVKSFRSVREEEVELMLQTIRQQHPSTPVNLDEVFYGLTNDVVCRVALGRKYGAGEDGKKFRSVLLEFEKLLATFSARDFIPWFGWIIDRISGLDAKIEKVAKEFDAFLNQVIEEHVDPKRKENRDQLCSGSTEQKDLVDVMLWIQRENLMGFPLDMVSIKASILDMFAAGTDTTYTVLEWAMTRLLKHPRVMKKLQSEVRETAGERRLITEDDLEKMHYLKAVIKETLRLHPPIPLLVPRESTQDLKLRGYDIKAGTRVIINAWAIGRDPEWWEEPEEFRPERFLNSTVDFKGHDFQLIPFGAGRRGCPGIVFATVINELALANLVLNFEWALAGGELDMREAFGLAVHRKLPLMAMAMATPCILI